MRRGTRTVRWVLAMIVGGALTAGAPTTEFPSVPLTLVPAACADESDLNDSPADLIDDAKAALELARGWVRRADDPNLEFALRRDARVQASDLLKTARGKLQAALEVDPATSRSVDPVLTETMRLLAGVRKSSGIGEGAGGGSGDSAGGGAQPKGAPPPSDDRPPTPRAGDAPGPAPKDIPGTPPPSGGTPGTSPPPGGRPGAGPSPPPSQPPAGPPVTVIPWEDWDRQYREITGRENATTAARLDALRALAKDKAIQYRGKILDVLPAPDYGDGATMLCVCGTYGGRPTRSFIVTAADGPAVATWARWDRIVWRERIEVAAIDRVVYRPIYRSPADLTRTPNPGVEYPRDVRSIDAATVWQTHLRKFAEPMLKGRWRTAYSALRTAASREYEIPGEVEQVTPEGAAVRPKGNQALETRDGRRFGPPRGTVAVVIDDPQVKAVVAPGTTVMLAFWLEIPPSARALYDARGEVKYHWRFHRLRDAKSK